MEKALKKVMIVFVSCILFCGGIISSTGKIFPDITNKNNLINTNSHQDCKIECEHLAYLGYDWQDCGLYEFSLDDPGNLVCTCDGDGLYCYGTWTNAGVILTNEYSTGSIVEINPETCEITEIGGGGIGLNGITMDPTTNMLYAASSDGSTGGLWIIDPETGEQEYIGDFVSTSWMIGLACNINGDLYGWDMNPDWLYSINKETGEATAIGSLGININYAADGHFCMECDILYIAAQNFLYQCDKETGACTLVGIFEGNAEATLFATPYDIDLIPPVTSIIFDPPNPDGFEGWYVSNVTVSLNATDNMGVNCTYFRLDNGTWEEYDFPFILSEDGEHTIEYYSIDVDGNVEEVKSSSIKIDQTPPEISSKWETYKNNFTWYIKFIFNATDMASGMGKSVEFYINDGFFWTYETWCWPFITIIEWSRNYKFCVFQWRFFDKAGWWKFVTINGSDIKSYPRFSIRNSINPSFASKFDRNLLFQRLSWWFFYFEDQKLDQPVSINLI